MRIQKTTKLTNGELLHAWWANNKGRGNNNCTLVVTPANVERTSVSEELKHDYMSTQTSSWAGNVNLSKRVCGELGIKKEMLIV